MRSEVILENLRGLQTVLDQIKGKRIVIVMGATGTGKSTLCEFLQGEDMLPEKAPARSMSLSGTIYKNRNDTISEGTGSKTIVPKLYHDNINNVYYLDLPGWEDSRDEQAFKVFNELCKFVAMRGAILVGVLGVVSHASIKADRSKGLREMHKYLDNCLNVYQGGIQGKFTLCVTGPLEELTEHAVYHGIIRNAEEARDLDQYWNSLNCMGERDVRLIKRLEVQQEAKLLRNRISQPYTDAAPIPPACFKEQFPKALTDGLLAWVGTLKAPLQAAYTPYEREREALRTLQQHWDQQNEVAAQFRRVQSDLRERSDQKRHLTRSIDTATTEITRLEGEQKVLKQQEPQRGKYTEEQAVGEPISVPVKHFSGNNKYEFKVNFKGVKDCPLSSVQAILNIDGAEYKVGTVLYPLAGKENKPNLPDGYSIVRHKPIIDKRNGLYQATVCVETPQADQAVSLQVQRFTPKQDTPMESETKRREREDCKQRLDSGLSELRSQLSQNKESERNLSNEIQSLTVKEQELGEQVERLPASDALQPQIAEKSRAVELAQVGLMSHAGDVECVMQLEGIIRVFSRNGCDLTLFRQCEEALAEQHQRPTVSQVPVGTLTSRNTMFGPPTLGARSGHDIGLVVSSGASSSSRGPAQAATQGQRRAAASSEDFGAAGFGFGGRQR